MKIYNNEFVRGYKYIKDLSAKANVCLLENLQTKELAVFKVLDEYNLEIYNQIKEVRDIRIPRIYDLKEENDQLMILEEYIDGESIEDLLNRKGCFSVEETDRYMESIFEIIEKFHNLTPAIINRDIKPDNIIIKDELAYLVDLNSAKLLNESKSSDTVYLGTPGFAAPEQYGFGTSTKKTDVYSLAVLLNIMQTGCLPNVSLAKGKYTKIIEKATKMDPNDRYQSVEEMHKAFLKTNEKLKIDSLQMWPKQKEKKQRIKYHFLKMTSFWLAVTLLVTCIERVLSKGVDSIIVEMFLIGAVLLFLSRDFIIHIFNNKTERAMKINLVLGTIIILIGIWDLFDHKNNNYSFVALSFLAFGMLIYSKDLFINKQ